MKTRTKLICTALVGLAVAGFGLSPAARGVNPPPDGGYPNNNTAEGDNALLNLSTGAQNTAMGFNALRALTTGSHNTATGDQALVLNKGDNNTATGSNTLQNNTVGQGNTATGREALFRNSRGNNNTATGVQALNRNQSGSNNTATGVNALLNNSASGNTATGASALFSNVGGVGNTADGNLALHDNVGPNPGASPVPYGSNNTAVGSQALQHNGKNVGGNDNTAVGSRALSSNEVGYLNTAVGTGALFANVNGFENTAVGYDALGVSTGHNNIALGRSAGRYLVTGDANIYIGNLGVDGESGTIRLGTDPAGSSFPQTATFIAGIYGQSVDAASGVPVQIDSTGKLGTVLSSARFKTAIKLMDKSSEALLALEPVTFQYKPELDPKGVPQFGLVAEQVERVAPQLVVHDKQGKPYTVRYEAVNAMLLNEFLKEHRKVAEQAVMIAKQQKQIEALAACVEKVSLQLQSEKPALMVGK